MGYFLVGFGVLVTCAIAFVLWETYRGRDHRGEHARFDPVYSAEKCAERVAQQLTADTQTPGKHRLIEPDERLPLPSIIYPRLVSCEEAPTETKSYICGFLASTEVRTAS
jgi:hypothetical protein